MPTRTFTDSAAAQIPVQQWSPPSPILLCLQYPKPTVAQREQRKQFLSCKPVLLPYAAQLFCFIFLVHLLLCIVDELNFIVGVYRSASVSSAEIACPCETLPVFVSVTSWVLSICRCSVYWGAGSAGQWAGSVSSMCVTRLSFCS